MTTEDPDRKLAIEELLDSLRKDLRKVRNQFPDARKGIKAIRTGIDRLTGRLEKNSPALAGHLEACIRQRNYCLVYEPSKQDIAWATRKN